MRNSPYPISDYSRPSSHIDENQFQSDPFDMIEARLGRLENMRRNEETLSTQSLTIPDTSNHVDENQESGILKTLTKIQFHHKTLNLTNINH